MNEIVIEIPAGYTGTVRLVLGGGTAAPARDYTDMLSRFEEYDGSPMHQRLANAMEELGFVGAAPKPRGDGGKAAAAYVRWTFVGRRRLSLYQNTAGLYLESAALRDAALGLPGAKAVTAPKVTFAFSDSDFDTVVSAAKSLRVTVEAEASAGA